METYSEYLNKIFDILNFAFFNDLYSNVKGTMQSSELILYI